MSELLKNNNHGDLCTTVSRGFGIIRQTRTADLLLTLPTRARRGEDKKKILSDLTVVPSGLKNDRRRAPLKLHLDLPSIKKTRASLLLGKASGSRTLAKQNPTKQVDDDRQR